MDVRSEWQPYHFDGTFFREGYPTRGTPVFSRDGFWPVVRNGDGFARAKRLPPGTGAAVVLCFIEVSGGKLQHHSGYLPVADAMVEIGDGPEATALRSGAEGYALSALPPGRYRIRVREFSGEALVEEGKTAFVAIRTGKRMAD